MLEQDSGQDHDASGTVNRALKYHHTLLALGRHKVLKWHMYQRYANGTQCLVQQHGHTWLMYRHTNSAPESHTILIRNCDLCELIPSNELDDNNKEDGKVVAGKWTVM